MDGGTTYTEFGAYWHDLTASGITIYRGADDPAADEQRVRIWRWSRRGRRLL